MSDNKIDQDIIHFLLTDLFVEVKQEDISIDSGLQTEIGVDSLGFVELMAFLEDKYEIKIEGEEFKPDNFRSVRQVRSLVERKLAAHDKAEAV